MDRKGRGMCGMKKSKRTKWKGKKRKLSAMGWKCMGWKGSVPIGKERRGSMCNGRGLYGMQRQRIEWKRKQGDCVQWKKIVCNGKDTNREEMNGREL